MMEHTRNQALLFQKVAKFLKPTGHLFVHIFCHKRHPYLFEDGWMTRTFFTGGTMPSADLMVRMSAYGGLRTESMWLVNGMHYHRTCEHWLQNLDSAVKMGKAGGDVLGVLAKCYGKGKEKQWLTNWRVFVMACSELFRYNNGNEWCVVHYLFSKNGPANLKSGERTALRNGIVNTETKSPSPMASPMASSAPDDAVLAETEPTGKTVVEMRGSHASAVVVTDTDKTTVKTDVPAGEKVEVIVEATTNADVTTVDVESNVTEELSESGKETSQSQSKKKKKHKK
jgi:hypothetical protein